MQTTLSIQIAGVSERSDCVRSSWTESQFLSLSNFVNCTKIPYCDEISKCACTVRFWVYPDRIQLLFWSGWMSIGFTAVKNTDCLFFLLLRPLGSIHFEEWNASRRRHRSGRCSRRSHPVTIWCLAKMDQRNILLNVLYLRGSTRIYSSSEDSGSIEISLSFLLPVPKNSPKYRLFTAKYHQILPLCSRSDRQILLRRLLLEELTRRVAVFWSWTLTLRNKNDRTVVHQCLSIAAEIITVTNRK